MEYQKIYNNIITRAQNRIQEGYVERHHIIPKCIGGSNELNNIVCLTAREHLICHFLLIKIYPHNNKLRYAAWAMCNQNAPHQQRYYKVSSRQYESLKKQAAILVSTNQKGRKRSAETIKKGIKAKTGKKRGSYKPKALKFIHTCKFCNQEFKSADVKSIYCLSCKEPRECKCGCGKMVKTPGFEYYTNHSKAGKSYQEIYGTSTPNCGFMKGNNFRLKSQNSSIK